MSTIKLVRSANWRRGNALVATLIISVTVGLAINLSSDRMQGLALQSKQDLAKLQARLAAESAASLVEGRLKSNASDTRALTRALTETTPGWVWGFPGYAGGTSAAVPGLRIGNCVVWWRIEPVKVWSKTMAEGDRDPTGARFALNPNSDDQNSENQSTYDDLVDSSPDTFLSENDRNFIFRIVTEAYYLKDPDDTTKNPRTDVTARVCSAQATRVVQYTMVNLFEYAIFYAAAGPIGDLEFWQGTGMAVKGRVHSNGAIYIGGGGRDYVDSNYHNSASGNGGLSIGGTGRDATRVTAVNGIYRMRKPTNYMAAMRNVFAGFDPRTPQMVPISGLTGQNNLNGDWPTDDRHSINGAKFTSVNDSRSQEAMLRDFGKRVRDQWSGATQVSSPANTPKFSGRPFEPDMLGSTEHFLFADNTQPTPMRVEDMSINRNTFGVNGAPIYYTRDPRDQLVAAGPIPLTFVAAPGLVRLTAFNLPLYWQDDTFQTLDVTRPAVRVVVEDPLDAAIGYETGNRTELINNQLQISRTNTTGLVIRERKERRPGGPNYPFPLVTGLPNAPSPIDLINLAAYMASQYQVRFMGQDITVAFFNDLTNAAPRTPLTVCTSRAQAIATEEFIVNRREANFMSQFFRADQNQYYVNLITINLRRVQDFLAYTQMQSLNGAFAGDTTLAKQRFNGVIYVHRTRRSLTYHPIDRPTMLFNTVPLAGLTPQPQRDLGLAPAGAPFAIDAREQDGPVDIFHAGVRVRGGLVADGDNRATMAAVNWQHDSNNDGRPDNAELGTSKLTFITPNQMYLWGDLNTTTYSDGDKEQRTPVAVFADGMNLLSANWNDGNVLNYGAGIPNAVHTSYATSFIINNSPCREWNAVSEGSGAVANVCRFLENWGGRTNTWPNPLGITQPPTYGGQVIYTFLGSLVVINEQRYSRALLGASETRLNTNNFYDPPFRNLAYNTDLKLTAGQPPESINALDTTRVVSLVNVYDN